MDFSFTERSVDELATIITVRLSLNMPLSMILVLVMKFILKLNFPSYVSITIIHLSYCNFSREAKSPKLRSIGMNKLLNSFTLIFSLLTSILNRQELISSLKTNGWSLTDQLIPEPTAFKSI